MILYYLISFRQFVFLYLFLFGKKAFLKCLSGYMKVKTLQAERIVNERTV